MAQAAIGRRHRYAGDGERIRALRANLRRYCLGELAPVLHGLGAGVSFTHLCVASETLHPEGIRTRRRYLGKVEVCIACGEGMEALESYLLPEKFRQAAFDFQAYLGLSLRRWGYCEITVEEGFLTEVPYQDWLRGLRDFLRLTKVEVNLLPFDQTFNYNMNRILSPTGEEKDYCMILRLYGNESQNFGE